MVDSRGFGGVRRAAGVSVIVKCKGEVEERRTGVGEVAVGGVGGEGERERDRI